MTGRSEDERMVAAARMAMAADEVGAALKQNEREPWWWITLVIVAVGVLASLAWGYVA